MRAWPCAVAVMVAIDLVGAQAIAADKEACVASYERAQRRRKDGDLLGARDDLKVCADPSCPAAAVSDCATWLGEVRDAIPTVIFGARDDSGADLVDVRVFLDGAEIADAIDGKPREVNPGKHLVRFEYEGAPSVEMPLVVAPGEKDRIVRAVLVPRPPKTLPYSVVRYHRSPFTYVFGALGVVAFGAFLYFDVRGESDLHHLHTTCGQTATCSDSDVRAVKTKLAIGDASLGVSIVSLGLATWLYFHPSKVEDPVVSFDLRARGDGGFFSASWRF